MAVNPEAVRVEHSAPASVVEREPTDAAPLRCASCDYDLRTLPQSGLCPECGTPIAVSLRSDRLERSDPLLVSACAWGISFLIAGLTCDLATQAVSMLAEFIRSSLLLFRLSEALSIFRWLEIPGLWMLLTGAQLRRKSSRILWVRVLIVAIALRETRVFET